MSSLKSFMTLLMAAFACGSAGAGQDLVPELIVRKWSTDTAVVAAPENHHFNLDAPNKAFTLDTGGRQGLKLKMSDQEAQVGLEGTAPGEKIHADLFVCDDAKTYCVKKVIEATVPTTGTSGKKKILSTG